MTKRTRRTRRTAALRPCDLKLGDWIYLKGGSEYSRDRFGHSALASEEVAAAFILRHADQFRVWSRARATLFDFLPYERWWSWWRWLSPEPRDESKPEWRQLSELELITPAEHVAALDYQSSGMPRPFRRVSSWWLQRAPEPRRWDELESDQLRRLDALTDHEREILAAGDACQLGENHERPHCWCGHITEPRERHRLGLPCKSEQWKC